ncbi:hypothetical protein GQ44DRAFT_263316 [Phaeosphaeriaceae sp. PMI808]|nr:hypothetical protein GQ44DRAFT_263316 [Phaeosphaeriaceae sp. PMI808]
MPCRLYAKECLANYLAQPPSPSSPPASRNSRRRRRSHSGVTTSSSAATASPRYAKYVPGQRPARRSLGLEVLGRPKYCKAVRAPTHAHQHGPLGFDVLESKALEKVEDVVVRVMETRKRIIGNEHPNTLTALVNLVFTLQKRSLAVTILT